MTRTYSLPIKTVSIAFLFALIAVFAFTSSAYAATYTSKDTGKSYGNTGASNVNTKDRSQTGNYGASSDAGGKKSGGDGGGSQGHGGAYGQGKGNADVMSEDRLKMLEEKLKELDEKKNELLKMMDALKNRATSTPASTGGGGDWQGRFCGTSNTNPGGGVGLSSELRKRICDRWDHSSSTPSTPKPPRATTTPMVQVISPNGGVAMKARLGGAVAITWKNTTTDRKVDIDLKKNGSTTVSIAKDVNGNRSGMSNGRGYDKASRDINEYHWKRAPIGEGYKIVITAKVGSTTYSDESDSAFSVKASSRESGMGGGGSGPSASGNVLGASTSRQDEVLASFAALEDSLAEMSVELSSL